MCMVENLTSTELWNALIFVTAFHFDNNSEHSVKTNDIFDVRVLKKPDNNKGLYPICGFYTVDIFDCKTQVCKFFTKFL